MVNESTGDQPGVPPRVEKVPVQSGEQIKEQLRPWMSAVARLVIGAAGTDLFQPQTIVNLGTGFLYSYEATAVNLTQPTRDNLTDQVRMKQISKEECTTRMAELDTRFKALKIEGAKRGMIVDKIAFDIISAKDEIMQAVQDKAKAESILTEPDFIRAVRILDLLYDQSMANWLVTIKEEDFDTFVDIVRSNKLPGALLSDQEIKRLTRLFRVESAYEWHRMTAQYTQNHPTEPAFPSGEAPAVDQESVEKPARYALASYYQETGDLDEAMSKVEEVYGIE